MGEKQTGMFGIQTSVKTEVTDIAPALQKFSQF